MISEDYSLFVGYSSIKRGSLSELVEFAKALHETGEKKRIAFYSNTTGEAVPIDLSGAIEKILAHLAPPPKKQSRGRPKLGVESKEITLLPKHWNWLAKQPSGASATLRRLVDSALKADSHEGMKQLKIEAAHRFLWDIAGDQEGFEEVTRVLFAKNDLAQKKKELKELTSTWPEGLSKQLLFYLAP